MFIPLEYQLDYLSTLHLFYYSFPNPIKVKYYALSNKQDISDSTKVTKSYYTHPLDDTSIAMYDVIYEFPVYFTQSAEPKSEQGVDKGVIFNQSNFSVVIPAIFDVEPEIDDFVYFSSSGVNRLFRVINIEIVNLFEQSSVRSYKLTLGIDKYQDVSENRIDTHYKFSYDFYKVLEINDYNYLYSSLFSLVKNSLDQLDLQATQFKYINVLLSKMYEDYQFTFDLLINKNQYKKINPVLENYKENDYYLFFDYPLSIAKIDNSITNYNNIQKLTNNLNDQGDLLVDGYQLQFQKDYLNSSLQPIYSKNQIFDNLLFVNYGFKSIDYLIRTE